MERDRSGGSGAGDDLTPAEVDGNFAETLQRLVALERGGGAARARLLTECAEHLQQAADRLARLARIALGEKGR